MFYQVQTFTLTSPQAIRVERKCFFLFLGALPFLRVSLRYPYLLLWDWGQLAGEPALPSGYRMKFICDACVRGTEGLKTTKNGHFISCELGYCSKRSPRDQTLNHFGVFKKGRNFFVLTHAKFQLFKEFVVQKERCKVTPGPPLQLKILSFTHN